MCGIVGLAFAQPEVLPAPERVEQRAAALRAIAHRGPDASGEFGDDRVWLGHARLSILDLSDAGAQPMQTRDGRYVIAYNGEIYNYQELARELGLDGLQSHSDTEVLLRAFASLGAAALPRLNGIFAFAIYDRVAEKLWLARDRLGVKPLYYAESRGGFAFGSEIEAVEQASGTAPHLDVSTMHEWLYYGAPLGEHTLCDGIRKLPPGAYLELDLRSRSHRIVEFWSAFDTVNGEPVQTSFDGAATRVRELLEQGVRRQLVSDVPVGIFLSGGIDSSAITAFASRHYGGRLATYAAGFDFDKGVNELPKARRVAQTFGTEHHEAFIDSTDLPRVVELMVRHHGGPFSDAANLPLFLMASAMTPHVKVVLQGDGGDELFGGYRRYWTLSRRGRLAAAARWLRHANALAPRGAGFYRRRRYLGALATSDPAMLMARLLTEEDPADSPLQVLGEELRRAVEPHDPFARYRDRQRRCAGRDLVSQMAAVDLTIILPDIFLEKVDRATMAASVEARVPFLDNDVVDYCLRVPGPLKVRAGAQKALLKHALRGVVPDFVLDAPKTGFGVPYGHWLRTSLRRLFLEHLNELERRQPGALDGGRIRAIFADHESGRRSRSFLLWKVLNLMIWANQRGVSLQPR